MRPVPATVLAILIMSAHTASAEAEPGSPHSHHASLEAVVVEMADTPEEHRALAAYYQDKATAAKARAEHHRSMAKHYVATKMRERQRMQAHCIALAEADEKAAAEYEKLAEAHASEAGD